MSLPRNQSDPHIMAGYSPSPSNEVYRLRRQLSPATRAIPPWLQQSAAPGHQRRSTSTWVRVLRAAVGTGETAMQDVSQTPVISSAKSADPLPELAITLTDMEAKLLRIRDLVQQARSTKASRRSAEEFVGGRNSCGSDDKLLDLKRKIKQIESQIKILSPMIGLLTYICEVNMGLGSCVLYYPKVVETRLANSEFRSSLAKFYECHDINGEIRCPVLGVALPPISCIAAHLFKHEWAPVVDQVMGFTDINDARNGLIVFCGVEKAFDRLLLCLYKNPAGNLVCWVLDPSVLGERVVDYAFYENTNQEKHHPDLESRLSHIYFTNLQDKPLKFCNNHRPYNRVLNFQARQATSNALAKKWITEEEVMERFEDYYSDGFDWERKTKPWLDHKLD